MQNDTFFHILINFPYPFLYRHDRTLYKTHSHLDPIKLFRNMIIASFCGYLFGKCFKRREILFGSIFPIPLVIKFFYDQWKGSQTLRSYKSVDFQIKEIIKNNNKSQQAKQQKKIIANTQRQILRNLPKLQNKYYNAKDFVNQLTPAYFNSKK